MIPVKDETQVVMTEQEAINEAIEALKEVASSQHFNVRAARMMGDHVPYVAKRGIVKRAKALEAIKVLQSLAWWQPKEKQPA